MKYLEYPVILEEMPRPTDVQMVPQKQDTQEKWDDMTPPNDQDSSATELRDH